MFALVWGAVVAWFGMAQQGLLIGEWHWIVRVLHLGDRRRVHADWRSGIGRSARLGAACRRALDWADDVPAEPRSPT